MITIIPAIDIIDGKCVRLFQGDYARKTVYDQDPVVLAKQFEDAGVKRLHLVDLDGAKNKRLVNLDILEKICAKTSLSVDFGGGITGEKELVSVFNAGASQAVIGSLAVKNPEMVTSWIAQYGYEKIIIGADVKDELIAVNAWLNTSEVSLSDFIENYRRNNALYFLCTDVKKDGMLAGSSEELYKKILSLFPDIRLIASGGVSTTDEIRRLQTAGVYGAIIGRSLLDGKLSMKDLSEFL